MNILKDIYVSISVQGAPERWGAFGHSRDLHLNHYLLHFRDFGVWATSLGAAVGPDWGSRIPNEVFWDAKVIPKWSKYGAFHAFSLGLHRSVD